MTTLPQTFNPPGHSPMAPTYSHISTTRLSNFSRLIAVAGQVGQDPATGEIPPTFRAQVEVAVSNLDLCLKAAGASARDIIQVRHYIVDLDSRSRQDRAEPYLALMGEHRPPSSLIGVQSLATKELLYEIEVLAVARE